MVSIVKAAPEDFQLLADIGKVSFIESHGSSASEEVIKAYVAEKYTNEIFKAELVNPSNIYHIIYSNGQAAGYSKIIFNAAHPSVPFENVAKLERLYLQKGFYGLKLGHQLLQHNIGLSQNSGQAGMWLFVWKGNHRAVSFYARAGFSSIGSYDFKLSETHYNPNHQMLLRY